MKDIEFAVQRFINFNNVFDEYIEYFMELHKEIVHERPYVISFINEIYSEIENIYNKYNVIYCDEAEVFYNIEKVYNTFNNYRNSYYMAINKVESDKFINSFDDLFREFYFELKKCF